MKINKTIIRIGITITIGLLLIGLPTWLYETVNAAKFPKTASNIFLIGLSFGYFILLMLCAGLAAIWIVLIIINFGIQIQRSKTKIIYFVSTSPIVIALSVFVIKFTVLPLGRILREMGNV